MAGDAEVLVWDDAGAPPACGAALILWRSHAADGVAQSIPRHLEQNAERLRARYLAWIHDLGAANVGARSVVDHLQLRPGFSFWWMTLLAEKSVFLSPQVVSALKLLALEDLLGSAWRGHLVLASADAPLAAACAAWCRSAGLRFSWRRLVSDASLTQRLRRWLPQPLQAAALLWRHCWRRWPLARRPTAAPASDMTLVGYLFNYDRREAGQGRFRSAFWSELPQLLQAGGYRVGWLLQYLEHEQLPDARAARTLADSLRRAGQPLATFDDELGVATLAGALADYGRVVLASWRLRGMRTRFVPQGSRLELWPLFADDWRRSLRGADALLNCLALRCVERAVRRLPRQRFGAYLQENIAWEQALVHAWRAAGHGPLVGVPHSTVRFWDLRYFFDPRGLVAGQRNPLPVPDRVALNGPAAEHEYVSAGYPRAALAPVEALRYLHLAPVANVQPRTVPTARLRVTIFGDYMPAAARTQMEWMRLAWAAMPADSELVVKPHPACPIRAADYPELSFRLTTEPIDVLLRDCDVAFVSNTTSAGVDAFSSGVPVVSVLDGASFNFSPLRGLRGVEFVGTAAELAPALLRAAHGDAQQSVDFFYLDRDLPRWRRLIGQLT